MTEAEQAQIAAAQAAAQAQALAQIQANASAVAPHAMVPEQKAAQTAGGNAFAAGQAAAASAALSARAVAADDSVVAANAAASAAGSFSPQEPESYEGQEGEAVAEAGELADSFVQEMLGQTLDDSSTIDEVLRAYNDFLVLERHASTNTCLSYSFDLRIFCEFLQKRGSSFLHFSVDDVRAYLQEKTAEGVGTNTIIRYLSAFSSYVRFLKAEDIRDDNPIKMIERPKHVQRLPMVMSEQTVTLFLAAPDVTTAVGLRDKAMFELLYACGLRVSELCNLCFESLNIQEQYLVIRGKGDKVRMIPMTKASVYWIRRYVYERRQEKDPQQVSPYVFLSQVKGPDNQPIPMTRSSFWQRVKIYSKQIGMEKSPSPHTFRHAFATHLLNHDADLRSLQMLLGHSSLNTTQIYMHVATARMHQVYDKAHPQA